MDSLVGFGFLPTNEEIIFLLKKKRYDPDFSVQTIKETDIYSCDPWELPQRSEIQSARQVWYFFGEPYYKNANGKREHRRTNSGYWKSTSTVSKVKAKNRTDVIASKRILSFYRLPSNSKPIKTEWVMHEFYVEDDESLYKKDFVICRIERKCDNKSRISTRDKGQSSQNSVLSSTIHVTEDTFLECILPPSQQLVSNRNHVAENVFSKNQASDNLISCCRNHVTENTLLNPQLLSIDHLISCFRNHVAENASPESLLSPNHSSISHPRNHVAENAFPEFQLLPNHNLTSHFRNHVAENAFPKSQLLPNHNSISHFGNHVAENTSPEFQLPSNHHSISLPRNHVAENTLAESQLAPNQDLVFELLLNQYLVSHPVIHVVLLLLVF